ncbi:MAG: NAD(P)H-binding protein, partial [Aquiluna sp.]
MIKTVTLDLPTLQSADGKPAHVLVTGATGYVGGRLVRELLAHNYRVRVLVRDAHKLQDYPWRDQVEIIEGDATDTSALNIALS